MDLAAPQGDAIRRFVTLLATAFAVFAAHLAPAAAEAPTKRGEPAWKASTTPDALNGDTQRTRFVVGLDRDAHFQVQVLSQPHRVVIELPDVKMQLPQHSDGPVGLVSGFAGGLSGPGRSRVVIDVTQPVAVENQRIEKSLDGKSYRLALELVPAELAAKERGKSRSIPKPTFALGAGNVLPPQPRPAMTTNRSSNRTNKWTVVIDPGHGGHDSGAIKHGTVEKDVVLAFSLMLRDKLLATGRYNVLMTRDTDVFVPLDGRREFAEKNNAHLFIAVHADYASTQARGATIYSLRDGMFNSLKRSAKNQAAAVALPEAQKAVHRQIGQDPTEVAAILGDLAQREIENNDNSTSLFRTKAIEQMDTATTLRANPEQQANFRVLLSAKVPSVLIELAYVSNRQDAKLLQSDEWRGKVSDSIATAVENYFGNQLARLPL